MTNEIYKLNLQAKDYRMTLSEIIECMKRYMADRNSTDYEKLIMAFTGMVLHYAWYYSRMNKECDVCDFISCGFAAAAEAIQRYNEPKMPIMEYVRNNVRWRIYDDVLRQRNIVTDSYKSSFNKIEPVSKIKNLIKTPPYHQIRVDDAISVLNRYINNLEPCDRDILLRYVNDETLIEIATRYGFKEEWARKKWIKLKQQLRKHLMEIGLIVE